MFRDGSFSECEFNGKKILVEKESSKILLLSPILHLLHGEVNQVVNMTIKTYFYANWLKWDCDLESYKVRS